jgi:hypothetical protein
MELLSTTRQPTAGTELESSLEKIQMTLFGQFVSLLGLDKILDQVPQQTRKGCLALDGYQLCPKQRVPGKRKGDVLGSHHNSTQKSVSRIYVERGANSYDPAYRTSAFAHPQ